MKVALTVGVLSLSLVLVSAFAVGAQIGPVVAMLPGTSYDGKDCLSVQLAGGVYLCQPQPTPQPTPTTPVPTLGGVPMCAHDQTKWHPLVEHNADNSVRCTYGHEHGMNPSALDSVFGPLPLAQEISYPWATVSSTGVPENGPEIKHRVYKWIAAPSLACSLGQSVDGSSRMVTAFRQELHADGNLGAAVRFHSYWGQYQVTDCATGDVGYITVGGHMDYANLIVGPASVPIPLANDPQASCRLNGDSRHEGIPGGPAQASVWYGASAHGTNGATPPCNSANPDNALGVSVGVNISVNSWGPVDPAHPSTLLFYADRGTYDGTRIITDGLTLDIGNGYLWNPAGFMDAAGFINFTGHTNHHGAIVPEVTSQPDGTDYIPLTIKHAKPGAYAANGAIVNGGNLQHQPVVFSGDVAGPTGELGYYVRTPSLP